MDIEGFVEGEWGLSERRIEVGGGEE